MRILVSSPESTFGCAVLHLISSGHLSHPQKIIDIILLTDEKLQKDVEREANDITDCAYPLLRGISVCVSLERAFGVADVFILITNHFTSGIAKYLFLEKCGRILSLYAKRSIKILVVGLEALTDCTVLRSQTLLLDPCCFSAFTFPAHHNAFYKYFTGGERKVSRSFGDFSEAEYFVEYARIWLCGDPCNTFRVMNVCSSGLYGVPRNFICFFPSKFCNNSWQIVPDISPEELAREMNSFSRRQFTEVEYITRLCRSFSNIVVSSAL